MTGRADPPDHASAVNALLSGPMIQMMMAADGVTESEMRALLAQTGARLSVPPDDAGAAPFGNYRYGVGIVLFCAAGEVLMARRLGATDATWQMPQGGIEPGETPIAAALREMQEEIGTARAEVLAESAGWYRYDLPPEFRAAARHGQFDGQVQKWFALRFTGTDIEINLHTAEPEFEAWRWVHPSEVAGQAPPFRQALYRAVVEEFRAVGPPGRMPANRVP